MMGAFFYLLMIIPLLSAALTLALRKKHQIVSKLTKCFSFIYFVFALFLLFSGQYGGELVAGSWPAGIGIKLKLDIISNLMLAVTGVIYFAGSVYFIPGKNCESNHNFHFLYNTLFLGLSGAFLTFDLFNLFVWFEVTLLSSYVLVVLSHEKERLKAGLKYILLNFLSGLIFLISVGLIYQTTKTLDFNVLSTRLHIAYQNDPAMIRAIELALFGAFAIKSAFFPLFFWLPESYPKLSPGLSGVFAGLLTKLGLYAMIRVFGQIFPADHQIFMIVLILSTLTLLVGVWGAVVQNTLREILSYHVISQVGFIGVGVSFCLHPSLEIKKVAIMASLFYMLHHILVKTNLFFVAGIVRQKMGSESISNLSGLFRTYPFIAWLFIIPAASLIGIPPFSGFWAKLSLFQLAIKNHYLWVVLAMAIGSFFTLFSMIKIWDGVFWGKEIKPSYTPFKNDLKPMYACLLLGIFTILISINPAWIQQICLSLTKLAWPTKR
jgi:multicomponent Na+:H+ antiporter subunit D